MTWTRLSDNFPTDPRLLECSRDARLLHVEALAYCNAHLTDGVLSFGALPRITDSPAANAAAAELCDAGLWEPIADRNAWQVDWEDQEDAAEVRERRRANAAKQARWRDRQARHGAGDHSRCTDTCPGVDRGSGKGSRNRLRNGLRDGLVTPSPPLPLEGDRGEPGAPDGARAEPADEQPPEVLCARCGLTETACREINGVRGKGPRRHAFEPREPVAVESKNEAPPAPAIDERPEPVELAEPVAVGDLIGQVNGSATNKRDNQRMPRR